MILLSALVIAFLGTLVYQAKLRRIANTAPRLPNPAIAATNQASGLTRSTSASKTKVSIIIPAYNEAENIEGCINSVLSSSSLSADQLEVWVVDDQSSDHTLAIVQNLQQKLNDPRLKVLVGQPRPEHQTWMGKNWACSQAVQQTDGNFLLFLDADVQLKPGAIEAAIRIVQQEQIDLLTCWPAIICSCFAEWLVQPLMASLLGAGFDFSEVNDPNTDTAFAVGPFMLFRRTAYEQLGGHQAVASEVVEDVELARRLKQKRMQLKYALGHDLASVRMYRSWSGVWEGWTKNWYLGSRRNLPITIYSAVIVFWVCTVPWLGLIFLLLKGLTVRFHGFDLVAGIVGLLTILLQFKLRQTIERLSTISTRYWWLTGLGGILVAAISLASIIKTETGWGWTWRGRSLKLPDQSTA